ncbi:MAG TPA: tyrosine-type recombinase/integrase [Candidatus Nanopelagicaceae bacterium]|nr:tyrosine-type recombinase/integrase [Candidatus Nanopelagicaceae bacterium]
MDTRLSGPTDTSESPPAQPRTPRYANGLPVRRLGGRRSSDDSFETLLDAFTRHLTEVEYRSGATGHTYAKWVRNFHQWLQMAHPGLGLEAATAEVLQEFLACKRGQRVKGSTLATILHSLRSFYSFTLAGDPTRSNPTLGLRPPSAVPPPIDAYSEPEVRHLLALAQKYEHSRDRRRWVGYVALTILAGTGIRNGELLTLRTTDVDLTHHQLTVVGKGSKTRTVPFGPATAEVLATYLDDLRPHLPQSSYFIANPRSLRHGPYWGRMESNTLVSLVRDLMGETAIAGRHFPHRFRHSFATNALRQVRNIEVVRELLGHTDIKTTGRYLHATMADKRAAADSIDFAAIAAPREGPAYATPRNCLTNRAEPAPGPGAPGPPQGQPGSGPLSELVDQAEAAIARALRATQLLPAETVSGLTSLRLAEAAIGTLSAVPLNSDLITAASALVLSRANHLPVPVRPLLYARGTAARSALERVADTLELLATMGPPSPN